MKKFLLSAALLATISTAASAQFTVTYATDHDSEFMLVANGDVIKTNHIEVIDEGYEYEIPCYFNFENETSSPLEVSVKAELMSNTFAEGTNQFCFFGTCREVPCEFTSNVGSSQTVEENHFNYSFVSYSDEIDLNDPAYQGCITSLITIEAGGKKVSFTVMLSNEGAGIEGVNADTNAPATYYNLQGVKVDNPAKGNLYIVKQGSKASKVIL